MAVSAARAVAFEILLRVERERSYAAELLHSARFAKLSSVDHGLATELVMGVLRWRSLLDGRVAEVSSQKIERLDEEVLTALRLGAYQMQFLSRVPARAAIFESVELVKAARKRSAASFVNAVLRKLAQARASSPGTSRAAEDVAQETFGEIASSADAASLARNSAHPEWLVQRWVQHFGLDIARQICMHNQKPPVTSVRNHDAQSARAATAEALAQSGIQLEPGHLLSAARTVLAGDVTRTQAYKQGQLAIQDEASQLVALLAGRGERILDCCAAPGGKTAVLARRNPNATVIAAELHPHRARLLRALVGAPNVRAVAADACRLPFATRFDCILADVPCSGTGTLARNPEIKWRLAVGDLDDLQARQIAILKSALAQLAAGGRLVYSTCSLEREENEAVVDAALAGASQFSVVDCRGELEKLRESGELGDVDIQSLLAGPYLRTIPGIHRCDGFFAAIIEAGEESGRRKQNA